MTCVLCATRGRTTKVEAGHCCPSCAIRLSDDLTAIERLCAAATIEPRQGTGDGGRTVPGSRPPINVDGLDPELTLVPSPHLPRTDWPTVLGLLESWARLIREERGFAPYGPATAHLWGAGTAPVLTEVIRFHRAQVEWATTTPTFPLEDYAGEIAECVRVLRKWDADNAGRQFSVPCPTLTDDTDEDGNAKDCGCRLYFDQDQREVTCRRCRVTRDIETLITVARASRGEVWVNTATATARFGITPRTLQRLAQQGKVRRRRGLYHLDDLDATRSA